MSAPKLRWLAIGGRNGLDGWQANAVTREGTFARVTVLPAGGVLVEEVDDDYGQPVKELGRFLSSRAAIDVLGLVAP